jgi:hypothetical protein
MEVYRDELEGNDNEEDKRCRERPPWLLSDYNFFFSHDLFPDMMSVSFILGLFVFLNLKSYS